MILLDTNVLSEPMKPVPDPRVLRWLDAQNIETLHTSATVLAELLEGVERMPRGKRRDAVVFAVQRTINDLIGPRVLPYDRAAAEHYARWIVMARASGTVVTQGDAQIASVAFTNRYLVATRDVNPFLAMGATVINPWEELPAPRAMSVVEALAMPEPDDIDLEHYLPKRRRE